MSPIIGRPTKPRDLLAPTNGTPFEPVLGTCHGTNNGHMKDASRLSYVLSREKYTLCPLRKYTLKKPEQ